jgi:hypothetical protein
MTEHLSREIGTELDFDRDVLPLSRYGDGGVVTERHILYAMAVKLLPDGELGERYALLGRMKSELIPAIFVPADDELMTLDEAAAFAGETDAILCYAYLGDVTVSPTGDKKAAKYEDEFLPELLSLMKERGVEGVTYMPSRNTYAQLDRVAGLCERYGFTQISGEDINSPGQSFICERLARPEFSHLARAARALAERERDNQ